MNLKERGITVGDLLILIIIIITTTILIKTFNNDKKKTLNLRDQDSLPYNNISLSSNKLINFNVLY